MNDFLPKNRLYHYRSYETAINHILPERKLRFNSISKTNDPRENKSFIFGATYNSEMTDFIVNDDQRNRELSDFLRSDCKTLCFSNDNYETGFWGYSHSRMWSLYGEEHTGICLGINKEEFIAENSDIFKKAYLRNVIYEQRRVQDIYDWKSVDYFQIEKLGKEKYLREVFRVENLNQLFFTKNKEWESEEEIRLLYLSENPDWEYCSISKSLKRIYLGVDFDRTKLNELINVCRDVDIYTLEFRGITMLALLTHKAGE